jgi:hypothetical protein
VENVFRVVAVELICAAQGVELRRPTQPSPANEELLQAIRKACPLLREDRPIGPDIERVAALIRSRGLAGLGRGLEARKKHGAAQELDQRGGHEDAASARG